MRKSAIANLRSGAEAAPFETSRNHRHIEGAEIVSLLFQQTANLVVACLCCGLITIAGCGGSSETAVVVNDDATNRGAETSEPMMVDDVGQAENAAPSGDTTDVNESQPASAVESGMDDGSEYEYEDPAMSATGGEEDYEYMAEYEGGSSVGAAGNRSVGSPGLLGSLTADFQQKTMATMLPMLSSAGAVKPEKVPSFRELANSTFTAGQEAMALNYLYAHMITEYERAGNVFEDVMFSPTLRSPVWQIRWGVSFHVRGDSDDPFPIVTGMDSPLPERVAGGMGMAGRMGGRWAGGQSDGPGGGMESGSGPGSGGERATDFGGGVRGRFHQNLGLVAELIGSHFESQFSAGHFGNGFRNVIAEPEDESDLPDQFDGFNAEQFAGAMEMAEGMDELEIDPRRRPNAMALPAGMAEGVTEGGPADAAGLPATMDARLRPGLPFVGEMPLQDALEKAKEDGIDYLLHVEVSIQSKKNRSSVRVVSVADQKTIVASKKLDNVEAYRAAKAERMDERAYVDEILGDMFAIVEERLKTVPLPNLSPDVAKRRIGTLLESRYAFDLASMAEVRLYQYQELLTEEEAADALYLFAGKEGLSYIFALPETRREAIETRIEATTPGP